MMSTTCRFSETRRRRAAGVTVSPPALVAPVVGLLRPLFSSNSDESIKVRMSTA